MQVSCGLNFYASWDNLFGFKPQGELSFTYAFGPKSKVKKACSELFHDKLVHPVDRNDIIVLDRHKKLEIFKAINPATNQPYFFWFVDNTSHSNGTFESPFNTLAAAQNASSVNDVIYVFAGDGTTTGLSSGIVLKDNQQLLGSGANVQITTTQGLLTIPQMTPQFPHLTNTTAAFVVKLANNNSVSGLEIDGTAFSGSNAIDGTALITNANISHNLILTGSGGNGIKFLSNRILGAINISNCSILGVDNASNTFGMFFSDVSNGIVNISNNLISGVNSNSGLARGIDVETFDSLPNGTFTLLIMDNILSSQTSTSSGSFRAAPIHIGNNFTAGGVGVTLSTSLIGNAISVPSALPAFAGFYAQQFTNLGSFNLFVSSNTVTSTSTTLPGYRINNYGNTAQFVQLLFETNNHGTLLIGNDPQSVSTRPVTLIAQ